MTVRHALQPSTPGDDELLAELIAEQRHPCKVCEIDGASDFAARLWRLKRPDTPWSTLHKLMSKHVPGYSFSTDSALKRHYGPKCQGLTAE